MADETRDGAKSGSIDSLGKIFGIVATLAAGISGATISYAQYRKSVNDTCNANYSKLIEFSEKTTKKRSELKGAVATLLRDCYSNEDVDQLLLLVSNKTDVVEPARPASSNSDYVQEKWVAVGFLPKDFNFTVQGKTSVADVKANDTITAQTDVFLRRGVANWSNPIGVLKEGQDAVVAETRSVQAGNLTQIWARIK